MERELWKLLWQLLSVLCKCLPRGKFGDEEILAVYFWAVLNERPISWACDQTHWPLDLLPPSLPSQPTMSRRMRTDRVQQLMLSLEQHLLAVSAVEPLWVRIIDAKALPVGGPSKDRDAGWGRGACAVQHGYKFHAVWGFGPLPIAWGLAPLNVSEQRMAKELIADLPGEDICWATASSTATRCMTWRRRRVTNWWPLAKSLAQTWDIAAIVPTDCDPGSYCNALLAKRSIGCA